MRKIDNVVAWFVIEFWWWIDRMILGHFRRYRRWRGGIWSYIQVTPDPNCDPIRFWMRNGEPFPGEFVINTEDHATLRPPKPSRM